MKSASTSAMETEELAPPKPIPRPPAPLSGKTVEKKAYGGPKRMLDTPSVGPTMKHTIRVEDFEIAFANAKIGTAQFLDTNFKDSLRVVLEKEYKCEIKDWGPMLKIWQDYNRALAQLYLTKALEVLSLPHGMKLEIDIPVPESMKRQQLQPKKVPVKSSLPLIK
jgi:hypothetical protein